MESGSELSPYYKRLFTPYDNPEANETETILLHTLSPIGLGMFGTALFNDIQGLPYFARISNHFKATAFLLATSYGAWLLRHSMNETRVRWTEHYVRLHPEDFPEPKRKKVAELFTDWDVIRS